MYEALILPFLEYEFMRRALAGCLAVSLGAPPVGVLLVLRRMSLTGDAIAHAIVPGVAVGYLVAGLSLAALTVGGIVAGLAVMLLAGFVARSTVMREDASLASFHLIALAAGVLIISLRGGNLDLLHLLFGAVLALDDSALYLLASVATVTLAALALLLRPLVMECLDPTFLRSVSRIGSRVHYVFLVLVVLNLVAGFHALGTLLAVGIMILPAASARFWARGIAGLFGTAMLFGGLSSFVGLLLSYHGGLPAGPAIVCAGGGFYVVSLVLGSNGSLRATHFPRRHLEA